MHRQSCSQGHWLSAVELPAYTGCPHPSPKKLLINQSQTIKHRNKQILTNTSNESFVEDGRNHGWFIFRSLGSLLHLHLIRVLMNICIPISIFIIINLLLFIQILLSLLFLINKQWKLWYNIYIYFEIIFLMNCDRDLEAL